MTDETNITFENIRFCYGEVCAVHGVDFFVKEKAVTALVGPNGGGKSTLLKIAAGLLKPDEGRIYVDNKKNTGYVAQNTEIDLSFPITVREIVLSGALYKNIRPFAKYDPLQKEKAEAAISKVGLQGFEHRGVSQLSGGQLKRALIARALASDAEIIILDEPDSSLDIDAARKLYEILVSLKKDKTILVASHNVDNILDIADSAVYVNKTVKVFPSPGQLKSELKEGILL
jgi:zinc transport system ATP-binding protein